MTTILITGADGFVGKWLARALLARNHEVIGAVRDLALVDELPARWREWLQGVSWLELELGDERSIHRALARTYDMVFHLAAISSGAQARAQPLEAWRINCLGTCALLRALERQAAMPRFVLASTGEVYGAHPPHPARESDPTAPCSPYAASKLAAEVATLEYWRRTGGDVVLTRPFAQTGPGQRPEFVAAAFAERIQSAAAAGRDTVPVGNLDPIREFMDVRDMAEALIVVAEQGEPGNVYNIAAGASTRLSDLFRLIADEVGWEGRAVPDERLFRKADIPYLVGDGSRIARKGWVPRFELRTTIRDLLTFNDSSI